MPPSVSTPARRTSGSSAARNARSSTIHASARSPCSYAENSSVAPASPSTRIDSTGAMRSHGSACQAPIECRKAALPGLIA